MLSKHNIILHLLKSIRVVYKPLEHQVYPNNHHKQCPTVS